MSTKFNLSWMPLHVADWLGSESVAMMSPATECAYLRLLMYQWRSDDGALPADPTKLQALTRLRGKAWSTAWEALAPLFPEGPDGRRRNPRLAAERSAVVARRGQQSEAGKASAGARSEARPEPRDDARTSPRETVDARAENIDIPEPRTSGAAQVVENQHPSSNGRSTGDQRSIKNPNIERTTPSTAPSLRSVAAVSPPAGTPAAADPPAVAGAPPPGVLAVLDRLDPAHRAPVAAYVAALEPGRQLAFVAELGAIANGMHGPGGKPATWWQIGAGTCAAIVGSDQRRITPNALRSFIHREPDAAPVPAGPMVHPPGTVLDASGATVWHPGMPDGARPDAATIAAQGWQVAA